MQRAVQVVSPTVESAVQQRCAPGHLLERIVLPQELVAAVGADVVEGADDVILAPHNYDRRVQELEFACEVAAWLLHPFDAAHIQPGLLEDVLTFLLVELRRDAVFE